MNSVSKEHFFAQWICLRRGYLRLFLAIMAGVISLNALAAAYEDQGIKIFIPNGFEGPVSQVTQGANTVAFVKKYPGDTRGTLLQITTYDFGQALAGMPEDARQDATDKYLAQFLSGVQHARQSFRIVNRNPVMLGGIKASRAEWEGETRGYLMSGVMYCVIVGTRVVLFHTQDFSDAPPDNRKAALAAIDSVSFAKR